ncbi:hypothetical protein H6P81_010943 [Aristolochia fimbriata]|uniref:Uncharacterized protein n=1 Tax=Aristolochia fimbriata TaxID=158543 RepID=A0AAV7EUL8_ARIFI|nr:hypothetical protein H6P81_010943 [Aristolochia fimbriata]
MIGERAPATGAENRADYIMSKKVIICSDTGSLNDGLMVQGVPGPGETALSQSPDSPAVILGNRRRFRPLWDSRNRRSACGRMDGRDPCSYSRRHVRVGAAAVFWECLGLLSSSTAPKRGGTRYLFRGGRSMSSRRRAGRQANEIRKGQDHVSVREFGLDDVDPTAMYFSLIQKKKNIFINTGGKLDGFDFYMLERLLK